jgi:large subunit ribosomal protein L4
VVQIPVHNMQGEVLRHIDLSDAVFAISPNQAVVHQALVRQQANARQGTVSTKTKGEVSGGGHKPYRQKGTGRARRGSQRSPLLRGGGKIFGPKPRNHQQDMPKKMRHLALRSVLSAKVADGEMILVDELTLNEPKTKDMARILSDLKADSNTLIMTNEPDLNVYKSARNLDNAKVLPANMINVADLLYYRRLMLTEPAVRRIEGMLQLQGQNRVEA